MAAVLMCSVVYLLWTHTILSRDDAEGATPTSIANRRNNGGGGFGGPVDTLSYDPGSDTHYEKDPRQKAESTTGRGGLRGGETEDVRAVVPAAAAAVVDLELTCPDGNKPDVDLSYWKDIQADK